MIKTIPVINNKGGVGKTTTSVTLAAGFARHSYRVLLVDLDSQGSAPASLGVSRAERTPGTAQVLYGDVAARDALRSTSVDGLDVLPGALDLADANLRLKNHSDPERRLGDVLSPIKAQYDLIVIDCAPSTSILTINALTTGDAFLVPVRPSYLSLEGVVSLGETVQRVRRKVGKAAPILGIVLTCVDRDDAETRSVTRQVRDHYGGKVFDTEIRYDPALETAPAAGADIFEHAPSSTGAQDYRRLLDEVANRLDSYGTIYGMISES